MNYKAMKSIGFAWCEIMAVTMSGDWKKLCPQFIHNFHEFEKVDEWFKDFFCNLMTLRKKLERICKRKITELLDATQGPY